MDLKSKLEMYRNAQAVKPELIRQTGLDVSDVLQGEILTNDSGAYFLMESVYSESHFHGGYMLGEALKVDMPSIRRICNEMGKDMRVQDLLFLDTETTGLSGGDRYCSIPHRHRLFF